MPRGDRTGPWGLGPRTGRAAGYCEGYNIPGYANPLNRMRLGRGRGPGFRRGFGTPGRGFGWGTPYTYPKAYEPEQYPDINKEQEKAYLEDITKQLEEELKTIKQRLQDLIKEKKEALD
ncbi:MAG: DUF5320 domain-containing protein [Thermoplasmatota archaeon]